MKNISIPMGDVDKIEPGDDRIIIWLNNPEKGDPKCIYVKADVNIVITNDALLLEVEA